LVVTAVALVIWANSPRESDLATVSQLVGSNQVAQLDLVNSTLTVTQKNGQRLRVESVTPDAFQPIEVVALNASVPLSISGGTTAPLLTELWIIASPFVVAAGVLAVLFVLLRMIRRPPPVRLTS
jgi:hypothetical protein